MVAADETVENFAEVMNEALTDAAKAEADPPPIGDCILWVVVNDVSTMMKCISDCIHVVMNS